MDINSLPLPERYKLIYDDPELIVYIDEPTLPEQEYVVYKNPYLITCINNPARSVIKYCGVSDYNNIIHLDLNHDPELQLDIFKEWPDYIAYIKKPYDKCISEHLVKTAIYLFPMEHITDELKWIAIRHKVYNARYFDTLTYDMQKYLLDIASHNIVFINNIDDSLLMHHLEYLNEFAAKNVITKNISDEAKVYLKMKYFI